MQEYETVLASNRLQIMQSQVLNKNCAKTWDLCLDIIKRKSFWGLAAKMGPAVSLPAISFTASSSPKNFKSGELIG